MTRPEIEAIRIAGSCSPHEFSTLCKEALEALELREALEKIWRGNDIENLEFRMPMNGHGYRVTIRGPLRTSVGEGSTPLEAINNARRRM